MAWWGWGILGVALLGIELLAVDAQFYLVFAGLAAVLVGLLGLVGLELRPRRLRDAANLWAALENAGGATLRDGRWAHPDLAPTSADLDDPIGYVERVTGAADALGSPELGTDLDSVLRGILERPQRL